MDPDGNNPCVGDGGRLDDVYEEVLPASAWWWERVRSNWKWVAGAVVAVGGIAIIYYLCRRIAHLESIIDESMAMSMIWEKNIRYRRNWRRLRRRGG